MQPSHYAVLEIPSTSTRTQVRAAYLRQIGRTRNGELPSSQAPLIETAYATLDNPSGRVTYDVDFAELSRSQSPALDLLASQSPALERHGPLRLRGAALVAAPAALAVTFAVLMAVLPSLGGHREVAPPRSALYQVPAAPTEAQQPRSPSPTEPSDVAAQATEEPASAPAAAAVRQRAAPLPLRRPAVARSTADLARRTPAFAPPAQAPANPPATEQAAAVFASAPSGSHNAPSLAQSSQYGRTGARPAFRIPGWFCHDASGGEIFVSAGAPLPRGVSCQ